MNEILTRLTMVGALYLSAICLLPDILISGIKLQHMPLACIGVLRSIDPNTRRSRRGR